MTARITKLKLTDFRSIRGTVDINLDAPVVLIHGPNGSGKTSLLSAIELGLTGSVASLRRFDATYTKNLVHREADEASVELTCRHPETSPTPTELTLTNGVIAGEPLLTPVMRRFYTERSFLAQATMSRLLEIYESCDARDDQSPLTRFVKDLLGLDALDDLITGLYRSGDKRLLRRSLPLYAYAETHQKQIIKQVDHQTKEEERAADALLHAESELSDSLLPFTYAEDIALDELIRMLGAEKGAESAALHLGELRREVNAALSLWEKADTPNAEAKRSAAEAELSNARAVYKKWVEHSGSVLNAALNLASELISSSPSTLRVNRLVTCCESALNEIDGEMKKIKASLERDKSACQARGKDQSYIKDARDQAAQLDKRLETLSMQSSDLARILSELVPFTDGDICPVCERDFSEVSETTLHAHLSKHIARLTHTAVQLEEVTVERRNVLNAISEAERSVDLHTANILDDIKRKDFLERLASLEEGSEKLRNMMPLAKRGDEIANTLEGASNRLNSIRQDQESLAGIRASAKEYSARLGVEQPFEERSTPDTLSHCLVEIEKRLDTLRNRENDRRKALEAAQNLKRATQEHFHAVQELEATSRKAAHVKDALAGADKMRKYAKSLSEKAIAARTDTVRRVFNESLNEIWKNLFIRLAPEEPFIPAFALPQSSKGPVEARLETRYRGGEAGGNPKAMLSAGNLNTAALTLFLSLHLSVKPLLPWLVIDDPVQSMDEIHIAQFAALLRTLSKQRDRQIIIAVHEKPLFDYLALELSPASEGDKLITVELSRGPTGMTDYHSRIQTWDPARVFQATG